MSKYIVLSTIATLYSTPHHTTLHFTSLYSTSLHFTLLHFTSLYFNSLRYTLLHFTKLVMKSLLTAFTTDMKRFHILVQLLPAQISISRLTLCSTKHRSQPPLLGHCFLKVVSNVFNRLIKRVKLRLLKTNCREVSEESVVKHCKCKNMH